MVMVLMGNARRTSCWATCSSWPALARFGYVGVLCQPVWDFRVSCHSGCSVSLHYRSKRFFRNRMRERNTRAWHASARARDTRPEAEPEHTATLYSHMDNVTRIRVRSSALVNKIDKINAIGRNFY
jgi:hypothetical protein